MRTKPNQIKITFPKYSDEPIYCDIGADVSGSEILTAILYLQEQIVIKPREQQDEKL